MTDLAASIQRNGQRVPILVRPTEGDRYGLIYGRRRLEACRQLGLKVRAIVTELEDDQALKDQLLENQARCDLSFIERALVAQALLEGDHLPAGERTNKAVAEVLNLTEAGVSQMLSVVRIVGDELVRAIGAAPGIGRPRWEDLKRAISDGADPALLFGTAAVARSAEGPADTVSDKAFLDTLVAAQGADAPRAPAPASADGIAIPGVGTANVRSSGRGKRLKIQLQAQEKQFVSWLEGNAPALIKELHDRWKAAQD